MTGRTLAHDRLDSALGEGGMGVVSLAFSRAVDEQDPGFAGLLRRRNLPPENFR